MTAEVQKIVSMLDMLPLKEQEFACEVVRKLIIAWDPDFTKLTPKEKADLELAHEQFEKGETVNFSDVDWE